MANQDYSGGIADFTAAAAAQLDPANPILIRNQAWFYATCPAAEFRDSQRAVALATKASSMGGADQAYLAATVAAAHAEAGDFTRAVEWQEKANQLAEDAGAREAGARQFADYRAKKPSRQTVATRR